MVSWNEFLLPRAAKSESFYDHSNDAWFKQHSSSSSQAQQSAAVIKRNNPVPPPYLNRRRKVVDLGRRRKRGRERRLEAKDAAIGKKSKITRGRDISEKVALGMYDNRLFNQDKGMNSGFATDDHQYNVYDKGLLFTAHPTLSTLYRPKKDADGEMYGGDADEQMEKILNTDRFKLDNGFSGTSDRAGLRPREGPVQFKKKEPDEEADPFGLDQFLTEVKKTISGGITMRSS